MKSTFSKKYEVIIVGAGIGGLVVGAYLSRNERKRVLVLERLDHVGGRGATIRGDLIKTETQLRNIVSGGSAWVLKGFPGLSQIVDEGRMRGYIFDVGTHAITLADRGRLGYILRDLEVPIKIVPNSSAGYYHGGKIFDMAGGKYPWMDEGDFKALHRVTKEMLSLNLADAERYDNVSLREWLSARTDNIAAKSFHEIMGSLNCSINDPAQISAGDSIKITLQVVKEGGGLTKGGFGLIEHPEFPGYELIAKMLANIIETHGGKVLLNATVKEIKLKNGVVQGVVVESDHGMKELSAEVVISNLPIQQIFSLIPEKYFPETLTRTIRAFWSSGAIVGFFGMARSMTDLKGFILHPALVKAGGDFRSDVRAVVLQSSNLAPSKAPSGKHLLELVAFLDGEEVHDQSKVNQVVSRIMGFLPQAFPNFNDSMEWAVMMASDALCPVAEAPGQVGLKRPDVKSDIGGLYFVGDTVRCWGTTVDAVVHSALLCLQSLTGKDYLNVVPSHQR